MSNEILVCVNQKEKRKNTFLPGLEQLIDSINSRDMVMIDTACVKPAINWAATMWHAARKQEKKVREIMVDYQKRAERRKEHYEKLVGTPVSYGVVGCDL